MNTARRSASSEKGSNSAGSTALLAGLLLIAGVCHTAAAAGMGEGLYYGAQLGQMNFDQDDVPDLDPTVLVLRLGYMLNDNFGVEGRLGGGVADDDSDFNLTVNNQTDSNANFKVDIENFQSIFGVARTDLGDSFSIYGLAGFTHMSIKRTLKSRFASGSGTDGDSSFSFGAGVEYGFTDKFRFVLEGMSYMNKDDYTATAVTLGVQF
jgi:opacity protein-like surface antigen